MRLNMWYAKRDSSVDQDQTAQNVRSDLGSTLSDRRLYSPKILV